MEGDAERSRPTREVLLGLATVVVVLAGMRAAAPVLAPALIGVLASVVFIPMQRKLQHRIGRVAAYVVTLALLLLGILVILSLIGLGVASFSAGLVRYAANSRYLIRQVDSVISEAGLTVTQVQQFIAQRLAAGSEIDDAIGAALGVSGGFGLMLLVIAFVLADAVRLKEKEHALDRMTEHAATSLKAVVKDIRDFLKITVGVGLVTGAACAVLFLVSGVDLALLWGLLIVGMSLVPYVGFWLAILPPSMMAALEHGMWPGIGIFVGCVMIHSVTSTVLKPKLVSDGLNLSPFTVFYSVVLWAFVLGPLGSVLGVPLTLFVKELLLEHDEHLSWLSMLMGRRPDAGDASETAPS